MAAAAHAVRSVTMTLYQGNQKNWQITVTIWAPMQKTTSAVKTRDPALVFIQAGASSDRVDTILESLLRQFQLILRASKTRKNFQFHTAPMKEHNWASFASDYVGMNLHELPGVQKPESDGFASPISGLRNSPWRENENEQAEFAGPYCIP
jgi:hypothetical protein